ncbi:MAG TPA: HU family DNA-binding protein, partial [bacterium]|nr:HU family DNA-binding protein [bacterium]
MKKKDLIRQVAESEDVPVEEVEAVVEEVLKLVQNRMEKGEETQIYGFGKFGVRWWKGRTGRDPQTGEEIEIEGRWIPYWSPSPTLIEESETQPGAGEKVGGKPSAASEKKAAVADRKEEQNAPAKEKTADTEEESAPEKDRTPEEKQPAVSRDFKSEEAGQAKETRKAAAKEIPDTVGESKDTSKPEPEETQSVPDSAGPEDQAKEEAGPVQETEPHRTVEKEEGPGASEKFVESADWPDIGDEISMKELRFISERLKDEPGESSAGLFFFDEEEDVDEGEDSVEVKEPASVSLIEEDEEEAPPEEESLEWAVTERRRGKFGWGVIITVSFALILFGGYLLLQERLPNLSAFIPDIQLNRESVVPDQPGNNTEGGVVGEPETGPGTEALPNTPESTQQDVSVPEGEEPYNFAGAARRETFLNIYNEALTEFEDGNYQTAANMLNRILLSDPPGDYLDNIHYWLGECQYARGQYGDAIREFELVFSAPNNNKVEDALI